MSELENLILRLCPDGVMKTTGTDIDKLMPPMSMFGGGREKKKTGIILRLLEFFERFFGIG